MHPVRKRERPDLASHLCVDSRESEVGRTLAGQAQAEVDARSTEKAQRVDRLRTQDNRQPQCGESKCVEAHEWDPGQYWMLSVTKSSVSYGQPDHSHFRSCRSSWRRAE